MLEWLRDRIFTGHLDSHYLLSATAQVLGALFALVFTITLIAVQFVTKYTHRTMKIIFNWRLIFYMAGFACSVILPLWWLLNPTELGTYISIVTGSLVVLSLILLFLDLKKRMNIGWIITCLKEEGLNAVEGKEFKKAAENIKALDNIGMGASVDRNFEAFQAAEEALVDFLLEIEKSFKSFKKDTPGKRLHDQVHEKLLNTCEELIDNPRAPRIVIQHLGEIGANAIKYKKKKRRENSITENSVKRIAEVIAPKTSQPRLAYNCAGALKNMLKVSQNKSLYLNKICFIYRLFTENKWTMWYNTIIDDLGELIEEYTAIDQETRNKLTTLKSSVFYERSRVVRG